MILLKKKSDENVDIPPASFPESVGRYSCSAVKCRAAKILFLISDQQKMQVIIMITIDIPTVIFMLINTALVGASGYILVGLIKVLRNKHL